MKEYIRTLYKNVPVLDSGARGSTITFAQRGIGQVLIAWENEAYYLVEEMGKNKFEIVTPSISILAEPSVAVVDKNVDKHGTRAAAEAYLERSFTRPKGQEMAAKHYYRPRDPAVAKRHESHFAKVTLVTIDGAFGGWQKAQKAHFADGGIVRPDLPAGIMSAAAVAAGGAAPATCGRGGTAACCPASGCRSATR